MRHRFQAVKGTRDILPPESALWNQVEQTARRVFAVFQPHGFAPARFMQRQLVEMVDTQRLTKDGRVVDVALSAAPLVDPASNQVIGEICSMRDITEHKLVQRAERELEQNRKLTQLIQNRLDEERRSIARELHDELGQCVTAIKTIGTAISNRTRESTPEIHGNAQTIVSVASHLYDLVHGIIRQLRPLALDHLG